MGTEIIGAIADALAFAGERELATELLPSLPEPVAGKIDDEWPPQAVSVNVNPSVDAIARDGIRMCLLNAPQ